VQVTGCAGQQDRLPADRRGRESAAPIEPSSVHSRSWSKSRWPTVHTPICRIAGRTPSSTQTIRPSVRRASSRRMRMAAASRPPRRPGGSGAGTARISAGLLGCHDVQAHAHRAPLGAGPVDACARSCRRCGSGTSGSWTQWPVVSQNQITREFTVLSPAETEAEKPAPPRPTYDWAAANPEEEGRHRPTRLSLDHDGRHRRQYQ